MTDSNSSEPINIGLDDGYAFTKLALPDGRLVIIPSGRTKKLAHAEVVRELLLALIQR